MDEKFRKYTIVILVQSDNTGLYTKFSVYILFEPESQRYIYGIPVSLSIVYAYVRYFS
jgi:hypothetical protein